MPNPVKQNFDDVYNQEDIENYARTCLKTQYFLADKTRKHWTALVQPDCTVVDIGGGYGLNSILDRELVDKSRALPWFTSRMRNRASTHDKLAADMQMLGPRPQRTWIGVDIADKALAFARERDLYQNTVTVDLSKTCLNLESACTLPAERLLLATGSFGYVGPDIVDNLKTYLSSSQCVFTLLAWEPLNLWESSFAAIGCGLSLLAVEPQRLGTQEELAAAASVPIQGTQTNPQWQKAREASTNIVKQGQLPALVIRSYPLDHKE